VREAIPPTGAVPDVLRFCLNHHWIVILPYFRHCQFGYYSNLYAIHSPTFSQSVECPEKKISLQGYGYNKKLNLT